jgi:hypothetical protein
MMQSYEEVSMSAGDDKNDDIEPEKMINSHPRKDPRNPMTQAISPSIADHIADNESDDNKINVETSNVNNDSVYQSDG